MEGIRKESWKEEIEDKMQNGMDAFSFHNINYSKAPLCMYH